MRLSPINSMHPADPDNLAYKSFSPDAAQAKRSKNMHMTQNER